MGSSDKDWERPWTMQEMIANAENWNLAGDVGLLNSLKAFADNMISKSNAISDNIDDLLNNLNNVSLRLDISKNEFQSLRNVQFIESRVYEEDETLETPTYNDSKIEEEPLTEEAKNRIIKNSISVGLNVMEKYFDKIHTHNAEGEIETRLQARNLYAHRPLPPLIGSADWSEMYEPDASENNSSPTSENEIETENSLNVKSSETSSELDLTSKSDVPKPLLNSTQNESSDSVSQDLAINTEQTMPFGSKSFADELASKLGTVLHNPDPVPEINTKPIQKAAPSSRVVGDLFADEPPPLDNFDDDSRPKTSSKGLFSGGEGLFDEDEDDLFKTEQPNKPVLAQQVPKNLFDDDEEPPLVTAPTATATAVKSNLTKGLFDSDESGDDDIFSTIKNQSSKPPLLQPLKTNAPIFDEEPPVLEEAKSKPPSTSVRKEPVGGVSQFFPELQKKLAANRRSSSESNDSKSSLESNNKESSKESNKKILNSLFDDDDEDGDLFRSKTIHNESKPPLSQPNLDINENQSKKNNLFDDEDNDFVKVPTKPNKVEEIPKIPPKKVDLFNDEDDDLFGGDLFGKKPAKASLFDDDDDDYLFSAKVESKPTISNISDQIPVQKEVINEKISEETKEKKDSSFDSIITNKPSESLAPTVSKSKGLFDDSDEDDLFVKKSNSLFEEDQPKVETTPKKVNLFDSVPPPVDDSDDWETKSETAYDDSDHEEFVTQKSNLFDNEPPLLTSTEKNDTFPETHKTLSENLSPASNNNNNKGVSSDKESNSSETDGLSFSVNKASEQESNNMEPPRPKPSPGKLKHNLNINVSALMPGYVPRPKQLVKSVSLDLERESSLKIEEPEVKNSEKATGFDSEDSSNILHSVTKDRARPAKRRPSSRRARQEILRKSVPDFSLYPSLGELDDIISDEQTDKIEGRLSIDKVDEEVKVFQVQSDKIDKPATESIVERQENSNNKFEKTHQIQKDADIFGGGKQSPLFNDNQYEDMFKATTSESIAKNENVTNSSFNTNQPERVGDSAETIIAGTSAIKSVLDDKESDDESLFPNLAVVPKLKPINTPKSDSFFDSPDSDDDLFASTINKSQNETKTKLDDIFISDKSKEKPTKQNLFGSESDDDDIFSTNKTTKSKKTEKKALFEDDSNDEDDIFGNAKSAPSQAKNEFIIKSASKVSTRTSNIRKLENVEAVEDPLSDLLK